MFRRLRHEERGDIIVTPAIMILLGVTVLLLGAATYVGGKAAGSKVGGASQGLKIDDNGNVVDGAVGIIPIPKTTQTPEPTTKVIEQTVYDTPAPAAPQQTASTGGGIVSVNPGGGGNVSEGESHTSNSSSSSSDTPEPMETHHNGCGGC